MAQVKMFPGIMLTETENYKVFYNNSMCVGIFFKLCYKPWIFQGINII